TFGLKLCPHPFFFFCARVRFGLNPLHLLSNQAISVIRRTTSHFGVLDPPSSISVGDTQAFDLSEDLFFLFSQRLRLDSRTGSHHFQLSRAVLFFFSVQAQLFF